MEEVKMLVELMNKKIEIEKRIYRIVFEPVYQRNEYKYQAWLNTCDTMRQCYSLLKNYLTYCNIRYKEKLYPIQKNKEIYLENFPITVYFDFDKEKIYYNEFKTFKLSGGIVQ